MVWHDATAESTPVTIDTLRQIVGEPSSLAWIDVDAVDHHAA